MLENKDIKKLVEETLDDVRNEDGTFDSEKIKEMFTLYYELVCNTVLVYEDITAGEITDPHAPYTKVIDSIHKHFDIMNDPVFLDFIEEDVEEFPPDYIH